MASPDPRIQDWTARVDGAIKTEVLRMHHHLSAWERVSTLIADNPDLPDSYWWEFMFETYASTQASAVRRQADSRRDVNSLMRLIMDVRGAKQPVNSAPGKRPGSNAPGGAQRETPIPANISPAARAASEAP